MHNVENELCDDIIHVIFGYMGIKPIHKYVFYSEEITTINCEYLEAQNAMTELVEEKENYIFKFGKYKNISIYEIAKVDMKYLKWICAQEWFQDKHIINSYLI
jgi:hypothetical protein